MKTCKVTLGPQYDANATIAVPELKFTTYFLRKASWILGKSFLAVSTFVITNSSSLRNYAHSLASWALFNAGKETNVNVIHFIHFHARFSSSEGCGGNIYRRTWNTSRSTAISDSFGGSTPRRDQARSEMQSLHLGLGRHLVSREFSQQGLPHQSSVGHSAYLAELT